MKKKKNKIRVSMKPTRIIALGFLAAILAGAVVLTMPVCSASGKGTGFLDALFTSATSICVTGLVTVTTAEHWSLFGQIVILLLIQLGGLGVTTVLISGLVVLKRRITLRERMLIRETYNLDTLNGLVKLIIRIIKGTFAVEGIGAVCYSIAFVPEYGLAGGIWRGIFNSVSAFCNAGMDILGNSSLNLYRTNGLVNVTTMILIILGGLGFLVWWDVIGVIREIKAKKYGPAKFFRRLSLHSKLVLVMTVVLTLGGTVLYLLFEYHNQKTIGNLNMGQKIMASLFQSVTVRTAGFESVPQSELTNGSSVLTLILMFIGGSPAGTAGGVKTTTIGVLIFTVISVVRGYEDTELFGRKVSKESVRTAVAVVFISMSVVLVSMMVLFVSEGLDFLDTMFEVLSAMGTVGLSRGVTGGLLAAGKLAIIVTMYIGRIGPITMAMAFNIRRSKRGKMGELPERRILIG